MEGLIENLVEDFSVESFSGILIGSQNLKNCPKNGYSCQVYGFIVFSIVKSEEGLQWLRGINFEDCLSNLLFDHVKQW